MEKGHRESGGLFCKKIFALFQMPDIAVVLCDGTVG